LTLVLPDLTDLALFFSFEGYDYLVRFFYCYRFIIPPFLGSEIVVFLCLKVGLAVVIEKCGIMGGAKIHLHVVRAGPDSAQD